MEDRHAEVTLGLAVTAAVMASRYQPVFSFYPVYAFSSAFLCFAVGFAAPSGRRALREGSIAALIAADMNFHMYVYEISGNRLFVDVMGQLWNHLRRAMREVLQCGEYRQTIWTEHAQIMQMIAEHNAEGAQALVRAHLQQAARNVELALPDTGAPAGAAGGHAPVAPR